MIFESNRERREGKGKSLRSRRGWRKFRVRARLPVTKTRIAA
jgi:hypothetical protein